MKIPPIMLVLYRYFFPSKPTFRVSEEARQHVGGFTKLGADGLPVREATTDEVGCTATVSNMLKHREIKSEPEERLDFMSAMAKRKREQEGGKKDE
jgi:hypothetical protein